MTANPLKLYEQQQSPAKSLEAHCAWLNGLNFVRNSGAPYTIGERTRPDGGIERFLTRAGA